MYYSSLIFAPLFFYCVSSDIIHQQFVKQTGQTGTNSCKTPDGFGGTCVPIEECPSLNEMMKKARANLTFLTQSVCGKLGEKKVCCDVNELTKCGKSNRTPSLIFGGRNASLGDWPWIVALGFVHKYGTTQWNCGGSLISDRWVLTAAHCVLIDSYPKLKIARLGELHLDESVDDGASPVDIEIDQFIPHPEYRKKPTMKNDIALLHLKTRVNFTDPERIRPICLPNTDSHQKESFYKNKSPLVAGWGKTAVVSGSRSEMLQEANVDMIDRTYCAEHYKNRSQIIDAGMLCASRPGTDACQGDSGGPLMLTHGSTYYLAGVVSFGVGCADPNYPGVYTKVAYYIDWIRSVTKMKI